MSEQKTTSNGPFRIPPMIQRVRQEKVAFGESINGHQAFGPSLFTFPFTVQPGPGFTEQASTIRRRSHDFGIRADDQPRE
jgi:hypothetical protein